MRRDFNFKNKLKVTNMPHICFKIIQKTSKYDCVYK